MVALFRSLPFLTLVLAASFLFADGQATQPADKDASITIDAVPTPATAHPGDKVKLEVTIRNNSEIDQVIDVPNYAWWAHSGDANIIFPSWPRMAGRGPVIIFKSATIAPGKTYSNTWEATVAADAPAKEITFRIGIPLHKNHWDQLYWSSEIKLKIESK